MQPIPDEAEASQDIISQGLQMGENLVYAAGKAVGGYLMSNDDEELDMSCENKHKWEEVSD